MPATSQISGPHLTFSVWNPGGLGDALSIARTIRDLQNEIGNVGVFDVYCHDPVAVSPVLRAVSGFRNAIYIGLSVLAKEYYDFSIDMSGRLNVIVDDARYSVLARHPALVRAIENARRYRNGIERFIRTNSVGDGEFADWAVAQGESWRDHNHRVLGIPYGGDILPIEVDRRLCGRHGLVAGKYVTIHDGWDANRVTGARATRAVPVAKSAEIVRLLKAAHPDLAVVQIGGRVGEVIPGVDTCLKDSLPFEQSLSILAGARLHIDAETGLVHFASALGVRSVVIFGPTSFGWFAYPQNANIAPKTCGNCWWSTETWMDRCPAGHAEALCMAAVDPQEVVAAASRLLAED